MDISSVVGFILAVVLLIAGMAKGSSLLIFVDIPSILIVVLGSIAAMGVSFPMANLIGSFKVMRNAFFFTPRDPKGVISLLQDMANRARREGPLALEEFIDELGDDFFARGVQMIVDANEPDTIEDILFTEIDKIEERHKLGIDFFDTLSVMAPAFGMIGTLIGLVQMLQNLSDPSAIGPAMAVALLTTFYGSLIANVFAVPIAKKLKFRSDEEIQEKQLIAQGLLSIVNRESPRFLVDRLNINLPPTLRVEQVS
ncbi:MAG: motility protein A [Myxococcota bacterium]|nr:motility protein A [Myxococcota bacterium]